MSHDSLALNLSLLVCHMGLLFGLYHSYCIFMIWITKHFLSLVRLFTNDSSLFFAAAHIAYIAGIITKICSFYGDLVYKFK